MLVVSFTIFQLYPREKGPWYQLVMLRVLQIKLGCAVEENNPFAVQGTEL
jgi:hypothetical protein